MASSVVCSGAHTKPRLLLEAGPLGATTRDSGEPCPGSWLAAVWCAVSFAWLFSWLLLWCVQVRIPSPGCCWRRVHWALQRGTVVSLVLVLGWLLCGVLCPSLGSSHGFFCGVFRCAYQAPAAAGGGSTGRYNEGQW